MLSRNLSGLVDLRRRVTRALRVPVSIVALASRFLALVPSVASATGDPECGVVDVEYAASANLKVTDTTMGAGDGVYRIGPGHIVLRFDAHGGPSAVRMLVYEMPQHFT